jgi:hypothetical protein
VAQVLRGARQGRGMSAAPKQLSPEDRLVAILHAVGAPLPRTEIYARVDGEYDSEADLAKVLGPLVASGRLLRSKNTREQFVYQAAPGDRAATIATTAIASAPERLQTSTPSLDLHQPESDAAPPPRAPRRKETRMRAGSPLRLQIAEFMTPDRGWLKPLEIAQAIGEDLTAVKHQLHNLLAAKELQVQGKSRNRRYASTTLPPPATRAETPTHEPSAPKRARNLAEFGAPPGRPNYPAPLPAPPRPSHNVANESQVTCALEDSGLFAITDGNVTIRMSPSAIRKTVKFLELTQHVWQKAA